jgi:MFS family permease
VGAALRSNRSLRRLLGAWLQSCVGTGLGYVALILLTVRHLHTSWAVAAVLLTDFLPSIVLGPWLGALADRRSKRSLIVTANLVQAGAWAALVFASSAPMILGFALLAGTGNALGRPAMRSALPIVAGESSQVAAAMYDTANWVGQTTGPLLAAALFVLSGVKLPLAINGASFAIAAAVIATLPIASSEPADAHGESAAVGWGIRAGLAAALAAPGIAVIIFASAFSFIGGGLLNVSEPLLALHVLHGSGSDYALLVASYCLGMVTASALVARQGPKPAGLLIRRYIAAQLLTAVGMGGSAIVGSVIPALLTFAGTGYGNSLLLVSEMQLIQMRVPGRVQGRLYGFKNSAESTFFLVGLAGAAPLVAYAGVRVALATGGAVCAVCGIAAAVFRRRGAVDDAADDAAIPAGHRVGLVGGDGGWGPLGAVPGSPWMGAQRQDGNDADDAGADEGRHDAAAECEQREQGGGGGVLAQTIEAPRTDEDERERRQERDDGGEQRAGEAVGGVADGGDRRDDGAGGDLAERDGVEEAGVGHPVVGVDRVALHQGDDHEAAAEGERTDLERGPGEWWEPAARGNGGE